MIIIMINIIIIIFICIIHSMCNMGVDQLRFDLTVPVSVGGDFRPSFASPFAMAPNYGHGFKTETPVLLRYHYNSCNHHNQHDSFLWLDAGGEW
jgi:hypothetical protein